MKLKVTMRRSGDRERPYYFTFDDGNAVVLGPPWKTKAAMKQWLVSLIKTIQADEFDVFDEAGRSMKPGYVVLREKDDLSSAISAARTLLSLNPKSRVELHLRPVDAADQKAIAELLGNVGHYSRFKIVYDVSPAVRGR